MEKRRLSNATDRRRRETEGERSERGRGRREEIANLYFLLQNVAIEKTTLFFAPSIVSFVLSKNFLCGPGVLILSFGFNHALGK